MRTRSLRAQPRYLRYASDRKVAGPILTHWPKEEITRARMEGDTSLCGVRQ